MEAAVLGAYEEDPYDQHNHLQTSFNGGLGESISFGRFAMDSFSWVKRSSFNHNQYLEELGSCSAPGSVREKKAYFEAYYKAKREALEKALADEKGSVDNDGTRVGGEQQKGDVGPDTASVEDDQSKEERSNETSISYGDGTDYHNLEHSFGSTFDNLEHSSYGASPNASSSLSMIENVDGQKMSVSEEESLEKLEVECQEQILQSSTESSEIIDVVEESIALSEPNPQEDYADGNGDDGHAGSIIDMHKEEFSNASPVKTSTPLKVSKMDVARPWHTHSSKSNVAQKNSGNGVSNATSKRNKSSMDRRGIASVEAKNHPGTAIGHVHVTVTVPQPFNFATSKRTGIVSNTPNEDGASSCKIRLSTAPISCPSPLKRTRVPATRTSMSKLPAAENNRQKLKAEQRTIASVPQDVIKVKEMNYEKELNGTALTAPSLSGAKSRPNPAKSSVNSFCFKSDERAEKRRAFNIKREAKLNAKQAEKSHAVAKTQEEEEEKVRQLRKSLKFHATPMPNFYQGTTEAKLETRKPGMPTTRAKSPKVGGKNVLNSSQDTNTSSSSSKQEKEAKTRKPESGLMPQASRNSSGLPNKTSRRSVIKNGNLPGTESTEHRSKERFLGNPGTKDHKRREHDGNHNIESVPMITEVKYAEIERDLAGKKSSSLTNRKDENAKLDVVSAKTEQDSLIEKESSLADSKIGNAKLDEIIIKDADVERYPGSEKASSLGDDDEDDDVKLEVRTEKAFSEPGNCWTASMAKGVGHESDQPIVSGGEVEIGPDSLAAAGEAGSRVRSKNGGSGKEDAEAAATGRKVPTKDRVWGGASPARRPHSPSLGRALDRKQASSTTLTATMPSPSLDPKGIRVSLSRIAASTSQDRARFGASPARTAPSPRLDPKWVGPSSARRAICPSH